jgi:hypothetical protein
MGGTWVWWQGEEGEQAGAGSGGEISGGCVLGVGRSAQRSCAWKTKDATRTLLGNGRQ